MNDITPKEATEILSHYTDLGYGIIIEGEDTSKIKQALALARKTLANGTPYNPSGDLISREALKAELEAYRHTRNYKSDEDEAQNNLLDNILEDIDNAPTVAVNCKDCDGYEAGYSAGLKDAERTKGEYISVDKLFVKCSICGNLTRVLKKYNMPNFCPACGADMRKGGKE